MRSFRGAGRGVDVLPAAPAAAGLDLGARRRHPGRGGVEHLDDGRLQEALRVSVTSAVTRSPGRAPVTKTTRPSARRPTPSPPAATDVTSTSIVFTAPRVPYATPDGRMPGMGDPKAEVLEIIRTKGHLRLDEPVQLASGGMSRPLRRRQGHGRGYDLRVAGEALWDLVVQGLGVTADAVGGLTMGADPLAHAIAIVAGIEWFSVRKTPKGRGTNRRVEGADLGPGRSVLVVEDVVTTGSSMLDAIAAVRETGATVAAAAVIVDRGEQGVAPVRRGGGVPYAALLTYADLGIPRRLRVAAAHARRVPVDEGHGPHRVLLQEEVAALDPGHVHRGPVPPGGGRCCAAVGWSCRPGRSPMRAVRKGAVRRPRRGSPCRGRSTTPPGAGRPVRPGRRHGRGVPHSR